MAEPNSYSSDGSKDELFSSSFLRHLGYGKMKEEDSGLSKGFQYESKPKILLMGLRRSGKSSIQKVVFHKMSPNETLFLESTTKIVKSDISNSSFVQFQIWDFPGQIDFFDGTFDAEKIFGDCGALIFVIDAQDEYNEALNKLYTTVTKAYRVNPKITFEIFIHKSDGLSDEAKIDTHREIHQQASELLEAEGETNIHLSFYLTSIYDHSIFEAFSKVIQKLIPQLPTLESLLNILVQNCRMDKAFLIDVVSKIYVATDVSQVDMQNYELCSDMIDVIVDVSCIYGTKDDAEEAHSNSHLSYDGESQSVIKLNNGMVLYMREVNRYLALVALIRQENFDKHGLIIDYNFQCLKEAIGNVFKSPTKSVSSS